jgi:hypothetical protein
MFLFSGKLRWFSNAVLMSSLIFVDGVYSQILFPSPTSLSKYDPYLSARGRNTICNEANDAAVCRIASATQPSAC